MRIRDIIAEALAVIGIFAAGYGLWIIGYGMGW
jgi:hypothetical protein